MDYQHQKVYPVDSDTYNMHGGPPHGPRYVMLSENSGEHNLQPPPYRRNIPRYHSKHKRSGCSCCCRLLCCCCCFFFITIVAIFATSYFIYASYNPQIPDYKVRHLEVAAFDVQPDFSLYTEFVVTVKAENPNTKVGIIYGKNSGVAVTYKDSILCSGKLPAFHQGHKNTTIMKVVLKGKSEFGSGLQEALMDNQHTKRIPLDIFVKVPVSIVLGTFQTWQVRVYVECNLVVDNLSPNQKINILSSKYDVKVKF